MLACFETLSPYVVQVGLYVLNSENPPISASQVKRGYRHTQPEIKDSFLK